jgi:predicted SnoaL-like aldol condensation-catalyzing enzyme
VNHYDGSLSVKLAKSASFLSVFCSSMNIKMVEASEIAYRKGAVNVQIHSPQSGDAIIDIFRVEDGKVVEHWDVIQAIPKTSLNRNAMF